VTLRPGGGLGQQCSKYAKTNGQLQEPRLPHLHRIPLNFGGHSSTKTLPKATLL